MPEGIRVEHALQSGSEIPPFYDSMIAKIISHGADRDEARGRLICGLEQMSAFGVTTNQGFLDRLPAPSCLCSGRGDHGVHRQASRRTAGAARRAKSRKPRWRRCCSTSPIRMRRHGAADGRWRRRSRSPRGSSSAETFMKSRSCASAMAAMSTGRNGDERRFEIEELGRDTIRFRSNGLMESARFLRRGRPALYPAQGRHALRSAI